MRRHGCAWRARREGAKLVWWRVRAGPTAESALADLAELLTPRCRLLTFMDLDSIAGWQLAWYAHIAT